MNLKNILKFCKNILKNLAFRLIAEFLGLVLEELFMGDSIHQVALIIFNIIHNSSDKIK